MIRVTRLLLDILKPHHPDVIALVTVALILLIET